MLPAWAQLRDTILYSMISKPFFYNVLKGGDGKIYAGTSEGVHQCDGTAMSKLDNRIGYLTLDNKELPIIDPDGIKYHNQTPTAECFHFLQRAGTSTTPEQKISFSLLPEAKCTSTRFCPSITDTETTA